MTDEKQDARALLGLAVYSQTQGKRVGEVGALLVHRQTRQVALVEVTSGGFSHARFLPFSRIRSIGADAVMIESETELQHELPREERQELETSLTGHPVISQSGERLGELTDYVLDRTTGKILGYRFQVAREGLARLLPFARHESVDVPDDAVISLGADALVVPDSFAPVEDPSPAEQARR